REGLFDCRETFLNQVVRNLAYSSFKAGHRRRLRDARTHQATTKHADFFYFHFNLLIIRRLPGYRTASGSDRTVGLRFRISDWGFRAAESSSPQSEIANPPSADPVATARGSVTSNLRIIQNAAPP